MFDSIKFNRCSLFNCNKLWLCLKLDKIHFPIIVSINLAWGILFAGETLSKAFWGKGRKRIEKGDFWHLVHLFLKEISSNLFKKINKPTVLTKHLFILVWNMLCLQILSVKKCLNFRTTALSSVKLTFFVVFADQRGSIIFGGNRATIDLKCRHSHSLINWNCPSDSYIDHNHSRIQLLLK